MNTNQRTNALVTLALSLLTLLTACAPSDLSGDQDASDTTGEDQDAADPVDGGGLEDARGATDADAGPSNPFAGDAAEATAGKAVYDANGCGNCHGADGKSVTFKDLSVSATESSDEVVFDAIDVGVPGTAMIAYGASIGDDDIWRIVTWVRTIE